MQHRVGGDEERKMLAVERDIAVDERFESLPLGDNESALGKSGRLGLIQSELAGSSSSNCPAG